MTKQEEIREGIKEIILATYHAGSIGTSISDVLEVSTDGLLKKLDSQGVVIKVDRELPKFPPDSELNPYGQAYVKGGRAYVQRLIEAGYVAIKPLIKE